MGVTHATLSMRSFDREQKQDTQNFTSGYDSDSSSLSGDIEIYQKEKEAFKDDLEIETGDNFEEFEEIEVLITESLEIASDLSVSSKSMKPSEVTVEMTEIDKPQESLSNSCQDPQEEVKHIKRDDEEESLSAFDTKSTDETDNVDGISEQEAWESVLLIADTAVNMVTDGVNNEEIKTNDDNEFQLTVISPVIESEKNIKENIDDSKKESEETCDKKAEDQAVQESEKTEDKKTKIDNEDSNNQPQMDITEDKEK